MVRFITIAVIILIMITSLYGQEEATFLKLNPSARCVALGEANMADPTGLGDLYINPAGLISVKSWAFRSSYEKWVADISFGETGVAFRRGKSTIIGLRLFGLSCGDFEMRNSDGELIGNFGASDIALNLTANYEIGKGSGVGFNFRYIWDRIEEDLAWGFSCDGGFIYQSNSVLPYVPSRLGIAFRNIGPNLFKTSTEAISNRSAPLPMDMKMGVAFQYDVPSLRSDYSIYLDFIQPLVTAEQRRIGLGFEFTINKTMALRMGYNHLLKDVVYRDGTIGVEDRYNRQIGMGFGFMVGKFTIDYAYSLRKIKNTHLLGMEVAF